MNDSLIRLRPWIDGNSVESCATTYADVYDPSTGTRIAENPRCTAQEVDAAIAAAKAAYPGWRATPVKQRAELLARLAQCIEGHLDELTMLCARENGKVWAEAEGDVLKAKEMTELAACAPNLLMGDALADVSHGYDTVLLREPLGVFAGIAPFNFPAMIPMGWMAPLALACGNTYVLKPADQTPMTSLRMAELYKEVGFPDGVLNVVPCGNEEAERIVRHPDIRGITFVGSTAVGRHVYAAAAEAGKRVQALCQAKNHALVLRDAPIRDTAARILNAAFGCAGERCMALSVIVVEDCIADELISTLVALCQTQRVGPAYDKASQLGPVVSSPHRQRILDWIERGLSEGATLALDGRNVSVAGYEGGFYVGHTILDHVRPEMRVGQEEIFGPVLCVKRVADFEEGLRVMNANPYANGSAIFTQSGYWAREFVQRTDAGMVGVNVGIPVPVGQFPFSGHKASFFGDLHCHGKDAFRFFTESKAVTMRWPQPKAESTVPVGTWEGSAQQARR